MKTTSSESAAGNPIRVRITIVRADDVLIARQKARALGAAMGLGSVEMMAVHAAVTDIGQLLLQRKGGEVQLETLVDDQRNGIAIVGRSRMLEMRDGCGAVLSEGSPRGAMGLGTVERAMDEFLVDVEPEGDVVIRAVKWQTVATPVAAPTGLRRGA